MDTHPNDHERYDLERDRIPPRARLIAYYLPQFHPIPENDKWWGKGFTEWTNVTKAQPLFRGHQQPRLPADLGFYDLRLPEAREAQAELAQDCGVEGFCYWHYWFGHGRRILERPFQEVLMSGRPNFPFCLCWANQTWSGIWHGNPKHTLIEQRYPGRDDEKAHFEALRSAFEDERYIKIDGRPLFLIYMPLDIPDPTAFVEHWRELAIRSGLPGLYFVAICNNSNDPRLTAFDSATPNGPSDFFGNSEHRLSAGIKRRLLVIPALSKVWRRHDSKVVGGPRRLEYEKLVKYGLVESRFNDRFIPCIVPNWDNTPRSKYRGVVVEGSTPELFRAYLEGVCRMIDDRPLQRRFIFLKAWNEWAEGNYVEPDNIFGGAYLDAIKSVMRGDS